MNDMTDSLPVPSPSSDVPRSEYPRPQFVRTDAAGTPQWLCLNGAWEFAFDHGDSGIERGMTGAEAAFPQRITVPFCPESPLSGIGHTDFLRAVWYRRTVTIPADWTGRDVLLHFNAVDYDATVWVRSARTGGQAVEVARHRGGFTPFTCELKGLVEPGQEATILLRARDYREGPQPRGKQSSRYAPYSCFYTRTTGIWQTVWMEPVSPVSLKRTRITPDVANGAFHLEQPLRLEGGNPEGLRFRATLRDGDGVVVTAETGADHDFAPRLTLSVPGDRRRLWEIGDPHLYDLTLELVDASGAVLDRLESYAGLRSVAIHGKKVLLNGRTVFQRLVLDQGYYPDGVLTAPSDDALRADIELSQAAGFNGARLHQKVFEERFLYWADKLGYIVWGEFPDWGCRFSAHESDHQQPTASYITQWLEELERDYAHPSLVGWCGLNETWQPLHDRITQLDDVTRGMFLAAKAMDATRPVLDASGYSHRVAETDVYDSHDYDQNPVTFAERHAGLRENKPFVNKHRDKDESLPYRGQPYFVSEFGGIWWNPAVQEGQDSWGYGERVKNIEEFYARFEGLCAALLDDQEMFGYCYTQLTDVWPEENGVYTFDRKPKFDNDRLRAVQTRRAAIEPE
jgi:beta-galactosidase/beta-glucuronidase